MSDLLDVKTIREMCKQLRAGARTVAEEAYRFPVQACLTVDGVVLLGAGGMMHPETYRGMFGEDAYQALLARPRVSSPYPEKD
jgi:hypothetical protein